MKTDQGKNKLYRFRVRFKRSKNGKLWIKTRTTVFASSDILAIKAIRSKYLNIPVSESTQSGR